MQNFRDKLNSLKQKNRYRALSLPFGVDLSSNDYLGFSNHPFLKQSAVEAIENGMPMGAGGSRLLRGHTAFHESLETHASDFFGVQGALFFSSGYQANAAIFGCLPARHDVIIFDELIHASARESIQNATAAHVRVRHNDTQAFEDALKTARQKTKGNIWIAVESLYSMDGDFAPLESLMRLAETYNAYLIIDEAHAVGVYGDAGCGLLNRRHTENIITLHTCGKALGVAGGLVCAAQDIIDTMVNTARPFIYSTAPPPLQAYLVQKALELSAAPEGEKARMRLKNIIAHAATRFHHVQSQIIPVFIGENARAVVVASALQEEGYDIRAIRPPTVAEGTARLRLSLNADLTIETLDGFVQALQNHIQW